MFSVVIPLFNKYAYIEKCLLSVLSQSFREFEIIVVNDGSTDDSLDKAQHVLASNKTPLGGVNIINQPNLGVSPARNNGVKAAKYEYIAFLDADDWWGEDFLKKMKSLISEYPAAGLFGSSYYLVKNGRIRIAPIGIESSFTSGYINYCEAYTSTFCMPLTSISFSIPKKIFELAGGFKPGLKFGEDFDLWIRVANKYPVAFLNKPLAYYNQDVDSNNRALGWKLWKPDNHYIFNLDYLEPEEKEDPTLKKLLDGLRVRSLIRYRLAGEYKRETQTLLQKVDFSLQPKYYQRVYRWPLCIVKLYFRYKKVGANLKQKLISLKK